LCGGDGRSHGVRQHISVDRDADRVPGGVGATDGDGKNAGLRESYRLPDLSSNRSPPFG
jgi:hypothetical protein